MDWQKSFGMFEDRGLFGAKKLHSKYQFSIQDLQVPVVGVRIWEHLNGQYEAECQFAVKPPGENGYFREVLLFTTPEDALEECVSKFFEFLHKPYEAIEFHEVW